jgi:hypothetical protein
MILGWVKYELGLSTPSSDLKEVITSSFRRPSQLLS